MDGVSGAVSLALKSTIFLYETFSGIKDGPENIQQLTWGLQKMSKILDQLIGCSDSFDLASDVGQSINRCAEDVGKFKQRLSRLSSSGDKRMKTLWKNIKTILQEEELERMTTLVNQHTARLSLELQMIEVKRGKRHEKLSQTQVALQTKTSNMLERASLAANETHSNLEALRTFEEESHRTTHHTLEHLCDKVLEVAGMSTGQAMTLHTTCNAILELLKQQDPVRTQARTPEDVTFTDDKASEERTTDREAQEQLREDECLKVAIGRLCHLMGEKETTKFDEDAQAVISEVQEIFGVLLRAEDEELTWDRGMKRQRKSYEDRAQDDGPQCQREIKRMKANLETAPCIAISEQASRPWPVNAKRYISSNGIRQRRSRHGIVTVGTRRRRRACDTFHEGHGRSTKDDVLEFSEASFTFLPQSTQFKRVSVVCQQSISYAGSFLRKHILSFSALLPEGSDVFALIENGDLEGLIKSLSLKEVRLNDRDSRGRCLLHYALHFAQSDICRFLLEKGADVDFLEPQIHSFYDPSLLCAPLSVHVAHRENEAPAEHRASVNRCTGVLFEAGADPLLGDDRYPFDDSTSYFTSAIEGRTKMSTYISICRTRSLTTGTETLGMLLDHGMEFMRAEPSVHLDTLLEKVLQSELWDIDSILFLLGRQGQGGLPIQNLDRCIYHAIKGSPNATLNELREVLILLIKAGGSLHAEKIRDLVCDRDFEYYVLPDLSKNRNRDLRLKRVWSEVLSASGHSATTLSETGKFSRLSNSESENVSNEENDTCRPSRCECCDEDDLGHPWTFGSGVSSSDYELEHHESLQEYADAQNQFDNTGQTSDNKERSGEFELIRKANSPFVQQSDISSDHEESPEGFAPSLQPGPFPTYQYEQSLLENDAQLWRE